MGCLIEKKNVFFFKKIVRNEIAKNIFPEKKTITAFNVMAG